MRGLNEKMTRSSSVVTRHDRRGSCVVMTAGGPASSPTAAAVRCGLMFFADVGSVIVILCFLWRQLPTVKIIHPVMV